MQTVETEEVLVGVISARGASGYRVPPDAFWTVRFELSPWKLRGEMREELLTVARRVGETELACASGRWVIDDMSSTAEGEPGTLRGLLGAGITH